VYEYVNVYVYEDGNGNVYVDARLSIRENRLPVSEIIVQYHAAP
jgi:hypothetical protein